MSKFALKATFAAAAFTVALCGSGDIVDMVTEETYEARRAVIGRSGRPAAWPGGASYDPANDSAQCHL